MDTNESLHVKDKLTQAQIEASMEIGVLPKNEYRGNITSYNNGLLVKKMIEEYEKNLIGK